MPIQKFTHVHKTADQALSENLAEIELQLKAIQAYVKRTRARQKRGDFTWATAGSASHVIHELEELVDFVNSEEPPK